MVSEQHSVQHVSAYFVLQHILFNKRPGHPGQAKVAHWTVQPCSSCATPCSAGCQPTLALHLALQQPQHHPQLLMAHVLGLLASPPPPPSSLTLQKHVCFMGDACPKAHTLQEYRLHPAR